jgi:hypothetical protein
LHLQEIFGGEVTGEVKWRNGKEPVPGRDGRDENPVERKEGHEKVYEKQEVQDRSVGSPAHSGSNHGYPPLYRDFEEAGNPEENGPQDSHQEEEQYT